MPESEEIAHDSQGVVLRLGVMTSRGVVCTCSWTYHGRQYQAEGATAEGALASALLLELERRREEQPQVPPIAVGEHTEGDECPQCHESRLVPDLDLIRTGTAGLKCGRERCGWWRCS